MKETLVVSHDAGGAEILSAWVKRHTSQKYVFLLEGPAKSIFARKISSPFKTIDKNQLRESISSFESVLTSASWASTLEKQAIAAAKSSGIKSTMYLDHWCNYEQRLFLDEKKQTADHIWVCDAYAKDIVRKINPAAEVEIVGNFYFEEIKLEAQKYVQESSANSKILYVSEPIRDYCQSAFGDPMHYGYDEFEALAHFLSYLDKQPSKESLRLRLHPSEARDKYRDVLAKFSDLDIEVSAETSLVRDCVNSQKIFGCDTMGLVIAVLLNKKAISVIPPHGQRLTIPYKEISYLFGPGRI